MRGDRNVCMPVGGFVAGKDCYSGSHDQCTTGWCKGSGNDAKCTPKLADYSACDNTDKGCASGQCTLVRAGVGVCRPTNKFANSRRCWAGENVDCNSGWCKGGGNSAYCKPVPDCPSSPKQCSGDAEWDRCKLPNVIYNGYSVKKTYECAQCSVVAYKRRWVRLTGEPNAGQTDGNCDKEWLTKDRSTYQKDWKCDWGCCKSGSGKDNGWSTRGKSGSKWCSAKGTVPGHYQQTSWGNCATTTQYWTQGGWDDGSESYCATGYERGDVYATTTEYNACGWPTWEESEDGLTCWCWKNADGDGCA